jgi:hypothetical protein
MCVKGDECERAANAGQKRAQERRRRNEAACALRTVTLSAEPNEPQAHKDEHAGMAARAKRDAMAGAQAGTLTVIGAQAIRQKKAMKDAPAAV